MLENKYGKVRTTIYLSKEIHRQFKLSCIKNDSNFSKTIEKTITEILNAQNNAATVLANNTKTKNYSSI